VAAENPTGRTATKQGFGATFLFWCISTLNLDLNFYYPRLSHKIPLIWGKIFSEQLSSFLTPVGTVQASGEY